MKKENVNVNYPFTHRRKYHLLLGGKLYFISLYIYIYICNICYCTTLFFKNFVYILHQSRLTWLKIFLKGLFGQHEECLG